MKYTLLPSEPFFEDRLTTKHLQYDVNFLESLVFGNFLSTAYLYSGAKSNSTKYGDLNYGTNLESRAQSQRANSATPIAMMIPAPHLSQGLTNVSDPVFLLGFWGS